MAKAPAPIIVVTGANGFLGSHLVKLLLEANQYDVRGTVRDPTDEAKTAFLKSMINASERLTLVAGDLSKPDSFDKAFEGAYAVIHTAASVTLTAPNPQRDIIDVNVNGIKTIFRSCRKAAAAGSLKCVVMTSSTAAVQDHTKPVGYVFSETDFNLTATVANDPYPCSKYLSEKWATDYVAKLPESDRFRLAFINPGAIYGPPLAKQHWAGSISIIRDLMVGKFPMCPKLHFGAIDVRDVARAHIHALEHANTTGRFICVENTYSMQEISRRCKVMFPAYTFPKRQLPNFLMYLNAMFDERISWTFCNRYLGRVPRFDNSKIQREFAFQFTEFDQTLQDTCQAFIDQGAVSERT